METSVEAEHEGHSLVPQTENQSFDVSSHTLPDSQTASEFIDSQLQLEAEAREALPYAFDCCTRPLGSLRQNLFSCLTCNPPPASPSAPYNPAGVCYSCSIACHGEHTLVELFNKRNFTCDCGTTRIASSTPCTLRIDPATGIKAPVHSQAPAGANTYNQNFRNRFCGCGEWYDAHKQEGTMFQCVGLATEQEGGCGEDWWHPECLLGVSRDWFRLQESKKDEGLLKESLGHPNLSDIDEDHPSPPDFPHEDDFEALICYKCVGANSWIKRYAGSEGFLPPLFRRSTLEVEGEATTKIEPDSIESSTTLPRSSMITPECSPGPKKRKVEDDQNHDANATSLKRPKVEPKIVDYSTSLPSHTYPHDKLLPPPCGSLSLLCAQEDYRSRFCRCSECYPLLSKHPQLLEEEEIYQPPLSEDGDNPEDPGSVGTGSLLDRGEAALSNVDRVRAIEGVMVYNHLKDKVKSFLQPFAESGQAVGAEDIKAYFEKLRGDAEAIRIAGGAAVTGGDNGDRDEDSRREQSGY